MNMNAVNVMDFGAKGDGVTDDTKAIQLAMRAAYKKDCVLYFPKNIYKTERQNFCKRLKNIWSKMIELVLPKKHCTQ